MDLLDAHNRDRKAEGRSGFLISLGMFLATMGVGVALVSTPVTVSTSAHPTTSPDVRDLQQTARDQAEQLDQLRTLLDACLSGRSLCAPATPGPLTYATNAPQRSGGDDVERVTVVRTETRTEPAKDHPVPAQTKAPTPRKSDDPPGQDNNVKKTTDMAKHAVENVIDTANKATSQRHGKAKGHDK